MADTIRLLLDWKLDAKHAIFVEAAEQGFYADCGLEVELKEPASKSVDALGQLLQGEAELAINYPHNIMAEIERCPHIVSIGALVKKNTEGLLSLAAGAITKPGDLTGRRVGLGPSPVSLAQLEVFCAENGLSRDALEVVTVGFDGEKLLLAGEIDALDAVAYAIPRTERKGRAVNFLPFAQYGVPDSPFLVFAAAGSWVGAHSGVVRDFLDATARGFEKVSAWDIDAWRRYVKRIPGREAEEEQAVWKSIRPLILGEGKLFEQDLSALQGLKTILQENKLAAAGIYLEEIFLNEYIP